MRTCVAWQDSTTVCKHRQSLLWPCLVLRSATNLAASLGVETHLQQQQLSRQPEQTGSMEQAPSGQYQAAASCTMIQLPFCLLLPYISS